MSAASAPRSVRAIAVTSIAMCSVAVAVAVVMAVATSGCTGGAGGDAAEPGVTPLDDPGGSDRRPADLPASEAAGATTSAPTATTTSQMPSTTAASGPDPGEALVVVADSLERYGAVLSEISADPAGAPAAGTPGRARWDAVVVSGSALSEELIGRVQRRAVEERVVVQPGPLGVSYRHVPVAIDAVSPTAIEFRWCGWSPGIGRSIDTAEVVDDSVAHTTGTGQLVRVGDAWRLAALDQLDLELLAPGAPDPCPASGRAGRP